MKLYTLKREQFVSRPLKEVFAFFERPENLAKITPESMGFHILTPSPIDMRIGAVIDYTVNILGIATHWRTLIAEYDPPHKFVDVQIKGPYVFWHHTHTFEATDGGTMIRDEVRYVLPFGWLGRIAHGLVVKRQLRDIFEHRNGVIKSVFGGNDAAVTDGTASAA